jgi:ribosomal protein S18 acetylase RimI-like enzyme
MIMSNNVAVNAGSPSRWAINNSVKNIIFEYVKNILGTNNFTPREHFENYFLNRGRNYITVNRNGAITGFAILGPDKKGRVRVHLVGTKPGKGYGRALMAQIASNARNRGLRRVIINDPVNNARAFYKKLGYSNDPIRVNSRGRVRNTMSMRLRVNKRKRSSPPSPRAPSVSPRASPSRRTPLHRTPQ